MCQRHNLFHILDSGFLICEAKATIVRSRYVFSFNLNKRSSHSLPQIVCLSGFFKTLRTKSFLRIWNSPNRYRQIHLRYHCISLSSDGSRRPLICHLNGVRFLTPQQREELGGMAAILVESLVAGKVLRWRWQDDMDVFIHCVVSHCYWIIIVDQMMTWHTQKWSAKFRLGDLHGWEIHYISSTLLFLSRMTSAAGKETCGINISQLILTIAS